MFRLRALPIGLLVVLLALAGCTGGTPQTGTTPAATTAASPTTAAQPTTAASPTTAAQPTTAATAQPTTAATTPTVAPTGQATAATTPATTGAVTVQVTTNETLGDILTDGEGRTLYLFLRDTQGGPTTCTGQCAQNWPLLLTEGDPVAGEGVDASLLGTVENADGSTQVTYNGWPLYYYAQDAEAGDTNGQGVGDVWYVVSPEGEAIED